MSIAGPDYQPSLESCSAQAVPWSLLELQLRCASGDLNLAEDEGGGGGGAAPTPSHIPAVSFPQDP